MVEFLQALVDDMEVEDSAYGTRVVPQFMPIPGEEAQQEVRPAIVASQPATVQPCKCACTSVCLSTLSAGQNWYQEHALDEESLAQQTASN
jgi:hypothetical protein